MGQACCALERRAKKRDVLNDLISDLEALPEIRPVPPEPLSPSTTGVSGLPRSQFAHVRIRGRQQLGRRNRLTKQRKQKNMPMSEPATLATHPSHMLLPSSETGAGRPEWNSWADAVGVESGLWQRRRHEFNYDGSSARREPDFFAPAPRRPISLYLPADVGRNGVRYLEAQASASQGSSVYYSTFSSPQERTPTCTTPTEAGDHGFLDAVLAAANIPLASGTSHIPSRLSQESNETVVRVRRPDLDDSSDASETGGLRPTAVGCSTRQRQR